MNMTKDTNDNETLLCDHCRNTISFGRDVIVVEKCVSGPRGVIPLGEVLRFCTEECAGQFFRREAVGDLPEFPRRIP